MGPKWVTNSFIEGFGAPVAYLPYSFEDKIYKADEKKDVFANAHLSLNFKQKPRVG